MALMVIHHKVRDYAAWRPAYDAHEPSRAGAGITNGRVYDDDGVPLSGAQVLAHAITTSAQSGCPASAESPTPTSLSGTSRRSRRTRLVQGSLSSTTGSPTR